MSDHDTIEASSDSAGAALLFLGTENEAERAYFRMRASGADRLTAKDLERGGPAKTRSGGARRLGAGLLALLAVISALAGAAPGSAAGLIPLAWGVIQFAFPLAAAVFAALAGLLMLTGQDRVQTGGDTLKRRAIFPGTGSYTVCLGAAGLQLTYAKRFWRARWSAFDAATLMASDMNGPGMPMVTLAEAEGVTLEALLATADTRAPAVEALIEGAAAWAERNSVLRLPLRFDDRFATRTVRSGRERLFPAGEEREYLTLYKRQFSDPSESEISWARFVAACVFMIQTQDPNWVERTPGEPDPDAGERGDE